MEEIGDVDIALLPLSVKKIQALVKNQRVTQKLSEAVVEKVIDIVAKIAHYASSERENIIALDINPLLVTRDGNVTAVDALFEITPAANGGWQF